MEPNSLTFQDLKHASQNFSPLYMIGRGKNGTVFEVTLPSGEAVAVKVLRNGEPGLNDAEFCKEFGNLSRIRHRNLVGHIKYVYETECVKKEYDGKEISTEYVFRALCYDYITNGSLENHLSDKSRVFDWPTRFKIIKGVCEGLKFLHEGLEEPIYHMNLKPTNILLDHNMVPKLADFSLPRLIQEYLIERPGASTYWPPEWVASKPFDVFSLGAVMIEIVTGQRYNTDISPEQYIDRVCKSWRKRLQKSYSCSILEAYCHQVKRSIEIAFRCVDKDPHRRPTMGDIVHVLNRMDYTGVYPGHKVVQNYKELFEQYIGDVSRYAI
ncbi:hypothetical protein QOZ80_5AG0390900 [Eleusine coracana subsp. coracana]|nr:hypothetical protein QOZ80_5AG0390900 [Eleusine coracana subsp. coracana]